MITEYHRPSTLEEALALLTRTEPVTVPLAGGTAINRPSPDPLAVVDIQALGFSQIERRGNLLELGAAVTLQALLDNELEHASLPAGLGRIIQLEGTYNLRQVATVAGTLVAASNRSPLTTALLALDAVVEIVGRNGRDELGLGDLLPLRKELLRGRLITAVRIPLNARLAYDYVARTPADWPLVCVAVARWPSGRTRVSLGGYGAAPLLALDGPEASGAEVASRNAYSHAGDEWASAEYRSEVAGILARRCLEQLDEVN